VSVSVTVVAPATVEASWERWTDFARWAEWNPQCVEARLEGPLAPGTTLDLHLRHPRGRDFYTRPRLTAVRPPGEIVWEARGLGLRAPTRTTLSPEPDGTRVTIDADSRGPLAFAYKMTVTDRTQALIYVAMLDALSDSVRG
jgi:Polyketide cyclase / dehydrase and lipid transport